MTVQREMPAHPASRRDRPDETHPVETVIHAVGLALEFGQRGIGHGRQQRERQKACGTAPPTRLLASCLSGSTAAVLGDLGEGVDPRLIDGEPMGDKNCVRPWR